MNKNNIEYGRTQDELHKYQNVLQARYPNSHNTHRNYLSLLKKYFNEFKGNIKRATSNEISEYIGTLSSESMMRQMHGALKNYYTFVLKQPDKIKFVPLAKLPDRLPDIPNHRQIIEMINKTENVKHKLILSMLYGTGIRLEEIISIRWKDIQRCKGLNPLVIKIHGKGNKDRLVPLSDKLNKLLADYCREYKLGCNTNKEEYVLGGASPYSMGSVNKIVKRAAVAAGVPFKVTPHRLRHAYAMYLHHQKKVDLVEIGKLMGHQSALTTTIYARLKPSYIETPV